MLTIEYHLGHYMLFYILLTILCCTVVVSFSDQNVIFFYITFLFKVVLFGLINLYFTLLIWKLPSIFPLEGMIIIVFLVHHFLMTMVILLTEEFRISLFKINLIFYCIGSTIIIILIHSDISFWSAIVLLLLYFLVNSFYFF